MSDERLSANDRGPDSGDAGHDDPELARELGVLARELTRHDVYLLDPPPELWDSIQSATATATSSASPEPKPALRAVDDDLDARRRDERTRRHWANPAWWAAAAAAVVLVAIGGAMLASQRDGSEQLVAQAEVTNEGLPVVFGESGTAQVRRDGTDLFLTLEIPNLPSADRADSFYEVWMIDTDVKGMVSLGVVPRDGRVDLPDDLDPAAFPVVDISVEPLDGDPTHSGQSILRGVLQ